MSCVYVVGTRGRLCKIGWTSSFPKRLSALRTASPFMLYVVAVLPFWDDETARLVEGEFHQFFAHARTRGEWFSLTEDETDWCRNFEESITHPLPEDKVDPRTLIEPEWRGPYVDPPLSVSLAVERRCYAIHAAVPR